MLSVRIDPPVSGFLLSRGRLLRASLLCAAALALAAPAPASTVAGHPVLKLSAQDVVQVQESVICMADVHMRFLM